MKLTENEQRVLDAYLATLSDEERAALIKATRFTRAELEALANKSAVLHPLPGERRAA
jgi:uncharacterized iron-regulated protein